MAMIAKLENERPVPEIGDKVNKGYTMVGNVALRDIKEADNIEITVERLVACIRMQYNVEFSGTLLNSTFTPDSIYVMNANSKCSVKAIIDKEPATTPVSGGHAGLNPEHELYPYLLRNMNIEHNNQVWSTDITYIPMNNGYMYLCAIIDWHSRYILAWGISNTHDSEFCQELLKEAIAKYGVPEIFNTDQGSEFTAKGFVNILKEHQIQISMDGKGRALDNIFIERFWRSVKYEYIYLVRPTTGIELYAGLANYYQKHNEERFHHALDLKTPK